MRPTQRPVLAALLAGALLTACGTTGNGTSTSSPTPPVTASPTAATGSPTPTSTLTAEQQKAVDEATTALMTARQIGVDLYSGARTRINDLDTNTTGDFHAETIRGISQNLAAGWKTVPEGAELKLVSAEPVKVDLDKDPPTVIIRACIDGTAATAIDPDGNETPGAREELDYTVVYTVDRPVKVWAVSDVTGEADIEDRAC